MRRTTVSTTSFTVRARAKLTLSRKMRQILAASKRSLTDKRALREERANPRSSRTMGQGTNSKPKP